MGQTESSISNEEIGSEFILNFSRLFSTGEPVDRERVRQICSDARTYYSFRQKLLDRLRKLPEPTQDLFQDLFELSISEPRFEEVLSDNSRLRDLISSLISKCSELEDQNSKFEIEQLSRMTQSEFPELSFDRQLEVLLSKTEAAVRKLEFQISKLKISEKENGSCSSRKSSKCESCRPNFLT